jgi:hypothetical protein
MRAKILDGEDAYLGYYAEKFPYKPSQWKSGAAAAIVAAGPSVFPVVFVQKGARL